MAINIESRTAAEVINGAHVWFVPDGTSYGDTPTESSKSNIPTFEQAIASGKCLGMVRSFRWGTEFKTVTKLGCSYENERYESKDDKILQKVKPTFSTQDVTPEAYALEYGMDALPAIGESARPFSNASGSLRGWLFFRVLDSLRTHGEDGELLTIHLRGDLSLADSPEHTDDLTTINYEFSCTTIPEDAFTNLGLTTDI